MESAVLFLSILVLGRAAVIPNECKITEVLNDKLQYEKRLMYMSDYFPLDYKFLVKHEEVLRCQNITNLRNQGIPVKELRYLWGIVNERILFKMKSALPGRHPSLQYVTDLAAIFKELLKIRQVSNEIILGILTRLKVPNDVADRKPVRPKALLDNCFKVLHELHREDCSLSNPRSDFLNDTSHQCIDMFD
ncbi:interleukin-34 isoform X2 [Pelobates fuscus]|uniref:interleukin-34 isoform X2 n=1 Tax=Pelobates fuscus TaxID=191477 RepID=UPI002FE4D79E